MSDDAARQQAIQRLHQRRGFMNYVIGAVVISLFMVVIWALSGQGYFWPIWVMGGFLIGGIFYGVNNVMNKPLTEDQIQREMQKGS
ncbi:MAG: 2TM domain-containing protein [Candidatus Nanopelagicales bacterium]|jgi:fatty acid desaturase